MLVITLLIKAITLGAKLKMLSRSNSLLFSLHFNQAAVTTHWDDMGFANTMPERSFKKKNTSESIYVKCLAKPGSRNVWLDD